MRKVVDQDHHHRFNAAKAAPINSAKGKKRDHSNLMCHYCNKKGAHQARLPQKEKR